MSDINSPAYSAKYVSGLLDQLSASKAREAELREKLIVLIRARIYEFDSCITAVAEALGCTACGGVDTDVDDPFGTAQVLITKINELKKRTIASSHS